MADEDDQKEEDQAEGGGDAEEAEGEGEEAGDGEGDGDDEGGGGKSKLPISPKVKKMILLIGAPILILVGIGAGLYFSGFLDSFLGKKVEYQMDEKGHYVLDDHGEKIPVVHEDEHGGGHGDDHGKKKDDHGGGHGGDDGHGGGKSSNFLEIPPMIVNLTSPDGNPRYLRLTVQLELVDPSQAGEVEAVMPRVIDQFQTYLRELRVKDLRGSAGIYRLQMELLWRVNQAAAPVEIKDVLFQEILIQ